MQTHGFFSPRSTGPILLGVGLVVAGVALIALTWYRISALVLVPAQRPLLVTGGLSGLVLVLVGLTLVNVHVKRVESARRVAAIDRLAQRLLRAGFGAVVGAAAGALLLTIQVTRRIEAEEDRAWRRVLDDCG